MKYKPANKNRTIILLGIVTIAIAGAYFAGFFGLRSAVRIGYWGNEGWSSWSGRYAMLDGTMTKTLHPGGDNLSVSIETESGAISMQIKDAAGNVIFDEENIGSKSFRVNVSGSVSVRIEARRHKGSFAIES